MSTHPINTECEKCGAKFETLYELDEHMEEVHGDLMRKRAIPRRKPKKK